jgi:uncharacterized protein YgiM (DUF1202 family)
MTFPSPRPVRRRVLVLALAVALGSGVVFAESATVRKSTELRATPAASADVVGELKAQESVDITARQGAWANVKTSAGVAGWARVLNFRSVAAAAATRGGADLGALFATGSTGATSTNSAKGFGSNDLMGASPDMAALSQLDGFAANAGDARSFAGQAPVQPQQVAYLPEGRKSR